jgi:mannitol-1-/sugar-/sorbitol-6-phosphatase
MMWDCRAILFDLDGILVDSRRLVESVWRRWGAARGIDPAPFIAIAHGRRTSETVKLVAPHLDARAEAAVLDEMEERETEGLAVIPGVRELIAQLPQTAWAVVTSGSRACATLRLNFTELPIPRVFITAADVRRGKPDPEGYLAAATRLGLSPAECVVIEDAPPGVAAAKGAGMRVIAVLTTHAAEALGEADARIGALAMLRVAPGGLGGLSLAIP